jgi:flagellar P-ring protein precursor FlgI
MLSKIAISLFCVATISVGAASAFGQPLPECKKTSLTGIGLVVGLRGTGDTFQKSPFTKKSLAAYLDRVAPNAPPKRVGASVSYSPIILPSEYERRAALVSVITHMHVGSAAFCAETDLEHVELVVAAMGDASSLDNGTLIMTSLMGVDGQIYAIGEGALTDCDGELERLKRKGGAGIFKCVVDGAVLSHPYSAK